MSRRIIEVVPGQSLWDLATQYYGSAEGLELLFKDNPTTLNLRLNSPIPAGTELNIESEPINQLVVDEFSRLDFAPATADPQYVLGINDFKAGDFKLGDFN